MLCKPVLQTYIHIYTLKIQPYRQKSKKFIQENGSTAKWGEFIQAFEDLKVFIPFLNSLGFSSVESVLHIGFILYLIVRCIFFLIFPDMNTYHACQPSRLDTNKFTGKISQNKSIFSKFGESTKLVNYDKYSKRSHCFLFFEK